MIPPTVISSPTRREEITVAKLFIAGVSGLLGLNTALQLQEGYEVSGCYHSRPVTLDRVHAFEVDASSSSAVDAALAEIRPDVIINTIGLTNVDTCETDPAQARLLNVETARNLATAAHRLKAKLVHVSTDQLFDGASSWITEDDPPKPLNVYGVTKQEGEEAVLDACPDALVLRTNFFGWGNSARTSFSDWILDSLEQGRELTMFTDVFFTPILIDNLVELSLQLVAAGAKGRYNLAGGQRLSKYDFAIKAAEVFGLPGHGIRPTSVKDFPFKARRPEEMSLSSNKAEALLGSPMPSVGDGLSRLKETKAGGRREAMEATISGVPA